MTFNTFDAQVPGVGEAWRAARAFADNLQGWLVLLGNPGSGKTHLAAAIANHAIKLGLGVYFGVVPDMLHTFKVAFRNGVIGVANRERGHNREAFSVFGISGRYEHGHGHGHGHGTTRGDDADYHALFERIRCASLLVLDDLGSEQDTPWARTEIYRLVNYRYQASLPTVITSNVDLDKLAGSARRARLTHAWVASGCRRSGTR
jgi:DNA replication protein DnaC